MNTNKIQVPEPVERVLEVLHTAGYEAYIVGGCVRDHLMGRTPGDYDVTTAALPETTIAVFQQNARETGADWRIVETGLQHGTVTVVSPQTDGTYYNVEVTTFRIDGEYVDNRHPKEVTFTRSLAEDLARRDFTVNAMAYNPEKGVIDLYDGQKDMADRVLRCVGEAKKRFQEDGLRILRALRFASVLDFTPCDTDGAPYAVLDPYHPTPESRAAFASHRTPSTHAAIHTMRKLLCGISRERIHVELTKLLGGIGAERILRTYPDVLVTILPELTDSRVRRVAVALGRLREGEAVTGLRLSSEGRYALLFASCPEKAMRAGVHSLKMSRAEERSLYAFWDRRQLLPLEAEEPRYIWRKMVAECGGKNGRGKMDFCRQHALFMHARGKVSTDGLLDMLRRIDALEKEAPCCTLGEMAVKGQDMIALGVPKTQIGQVLAALLEKVWRDELPNDRAVLLAKAEGMKNGKLP